MRLIRLTYDCCFPGFYLSEANEVRHTTAVQAQLIDHGEPLVEKNIAVWPEYIDSTIHWNSIANRNISGTKIENLALYLK